MTPGIHIDRLVLDLPFLEGTDPGSDAARDLDEFARNRLLPAVQTVFSQRFAPDADLYLDRLVVDLGIFPNGPMAPDLIPRLEKSLHKALDGIVDKSTDAALPGFSFLGNAFSCLLDTGRGGPLDDLWIPLSGRYPGRTRSLLLQRGRSARVREHIIDLFPRHRLTGLVRLLDPLDSRFINFLVKRPAWFYTRLVAPKTGRTLFERQLLLFILAFLFVRKAGRFGKRIFLADVIQKTAAHYNLGYIPFLTSLVRLFETTRDPSPIRREILSCLVELEQAETPHPAARAPAVEAVMARAAKSGRDPLAGLTRLILSSPETVGLFLERHRQRPRAIQTFAGLATPPLVDRLISHLFPHGYPWASGAMALLTRPRYSRLLAGSPEAAFPAVTTALLTVSPWFRQSLGRMLDILADQSRTPRQFFFRELIMELVLDPARSPVRDHFLKAALDRIGIRHSVEVLRFRGSEQMVRAKPFLLFFARHSRVREQISHTFPQDRLPDLIRLVEPAHWEFIHTAATVSDRVADTAAGLDNRRFKQDTWDFILTFLVNDRGSRFNQKSFTSAMIQRMARRHHLDYGSLVTVLKSAALKSGRESAKRLADILSELATEHKAPPVRASFAAADQAQALEDLMRLGQVPPRPPGEIVNFLERRHPALLYRLFHRFGSDPPPGSLQRLSPELLRLLIQTWLKIRPHTDAGGLMTAIFREEKRRSDRPAFYAGVLAQLIRSGTVSFPVQADAGTGTKHPSIKARHGTPLTNKKDDRQYHQVKTRHRENRHRLKRLLTPPFSPALAAYLTKRLADPAFTRFLARQADQALMIRLFHLTAPRDYARVGDAAILVFTLLAPVNGSPGERQVWQMMLDILSDPGFPVFDTELFLSRLLRQMVRPLPRPAGHRFLKAVRDRLGQAPAIFSTELTADAGRVLDRMLAATRPDLAAEPPPDDTRSIPEGKGTADKGPANENPADENMDTPQSPAAVHNAGLVLASPYLPRLFETLGLTENDAFPDPSLARKAVMILEYMVDPRLSAPEGGLTLNRLLCGLPESVPGAPLPALSKRDKETVEGLINAMIQNWSTIKNTSVEGFRESFLLRDGLLNQKEDGSWHLDVSQKAFDMLLDTLPWGFSTIRHPWMPAVLHVRWR